MKRVFYKVLLTLSVLFCISCKAILTPTSGNQNPSNPETTDPSTPGTTDPTTPGTTDPVTPSEPELKINITSDFEDFSLNYNYNQSTKIYSISLISSIDFENLSWYLNNTKLPQTGKEIEIDTNTLQKNGVYHLLVTGVNNGIAYSAELMISKN